MGESRRRPGRAVPRRSGRAGRSVARRVGRVGSSGALPALALLVAGLPAVSACSGTGAAGAGGADAGVPDEPPAPDAGLDADALVPGLSRETALERLAGIDGRTPTCTSAKVAAPGTGRAFLHERCRLDWASPSPVLHRSSADPSGGGEPLALATAHVDLVDGTVLRVDLVFEPPGTPPVPAPAAGVEARVIDVPEAAPGTRALVTIDARAARALPALAERAPPAPLS